ncbi:BA14K family protein [Phyllobacterium phragmitis]|nr:BA14K family protein [Phyllobacterium phragmitis]
MMMSRTLWMVLLAGSWLLPAVSAASAIEIRQQSGIQPLRPESPSIVGGTGSGGGSYYSEQGVLHYKNGDPIEQRQRSPGVKARGATPSVNHIQWCQNRYRSYSINDNTYQPFAGTRRGCSSPFSP